MKKLPIHRRPYSAKRILEIGGGHAPYQGVTHAVDKFPGDNTQRAGSMVVAAGVTFREGELEAIPFESEPAFDFLYASHVLEHVGSPAKAIAEVNRVSRKGYIETPSPLREQIACPVPFDPAGDFHFWFCWTGRESSNTIHVIRKSADSIGDFCDCPNGRLARALYQIRRSDGIDVEPLLPREAKTTRLFFKGTIRLVEHRSFKEACATGQCGYENARDVRRWSGPVSSRLSGRFKRLRELLRGHTTRGPIRTLTSDTEFNASVEKLDRTALVLFHTPWSGGSKIQRQLFGELAATHGDRAEFFEIDAEKSPQLSEKLKIRTVPSTALVRGGKVVRILAGNQTAAALIASLGEINNVVQGAP